MNELHQFQLSGKMVLLLSACKNDSVFLGQSTTFLFPFFFFFPRGIHMESILIFHTIAVLTFQTLQSKVFMILDFFFFYDIVSMFL